MFDYEKNLHVNTQSTSVSQPTSEGNSDAQYPKNNFTNIFMGMTKADIEAIEDEELKIKLGDEFKKANTDGDDVISENEFNNYNTLKTEQAETAPKPEVVVYAPKIEGSTAVNLDQEKIPTDLYPNMTKEEAEKYKLTEQFNKANTDNDELLSFEEFEAFIRETKGNRADLILKRERAIQEQLKNNPYLSRTVVIDVIANGEIDKLSEKLNDILSVLQIDPKSKEYQKAESLSDEELQSVFEIIRNNKPALYSGITRAEAERIGGKTLEDFNAVCPEGQDVVNLSDIIKSALNQVIASGISPERIMKTTALAKGQEKIEIALSLTDIIVDQREGKHEFDNITNVEECLDKLGVSQNQRNAYKDDRKTYGALLGSKVKDMFLNDMRFEDKESLLARQYERIKEGDFTEEEKAKGLYSGAEIDDETALKLASEAVLQTYIATVRNIVKQVCENGDDKDKQVILTSLFEALKGIPGLQRILECIPLESIIDETLKQQSISDVIENDNLEGLKDSSADCLILASTIINNSNEETITQFFEKYSENINNLKPLADTIINNMPEGERKTALQNAVEQTYQNITSEGGNSGNTGSVISSKTNSNSSGNYTVNTDNSANMFPNNGITNPMIQQVAEIRAASKTMESSPKKMSLHEKRMQEHAIEMKKIEALHKAMRTKMKIKMLELKNKSIGSALSEIYSHYNEMPDKFKLKFLSHLRVMQTNHLCEAYITGDSQFREFLTNMQYVNQSMLNNYFDSNPAELKKAPINIQRRYYEEKSEEMYAEYSKGNVIGTESKSHWHDYS